MFTKQLAQRFTPLLMSRTGNMVQQQSFHSFNLGKDLQIESMSHQQDGVTGLMQKASDKHVATYTQQVAGPISQDVFGQMAQKVHEVRPGVKTNTNTTAMFHQENLPKLQLRDPNEATLNASAGVVMTTQKRQQKVQLHESAGNMVFDSRRSHKNHFKGVEE